MLRHKLSSTFSKSDRSADEKDMARPSVENNTTPKLPKSTSVSRFMEKLKHSRSGTASSTASSSASDLRMSTGPSAYANQPLDSDPDVQEDQSSRDTPRQSLAPGASVPSDTGDEVADAFKEEAAMMWRFEEERRAAEADKTRKLVKRWDWERSQKAKLLANQLGEELDRGQEAHAQTTDEVSAVELDGEDTAIVSEHEPRIASADVPSSVPFAYSVHGPDGALIEGDGEGTATSSANLMTDAPVTPAILEPTRTTAMTAMPASTTAMRDFTSAMYSTTPLRIVVTTRIETTSEPLNATIYPRKRMRVGPYTITSPKLASTMFSGVILLYLGIVVSAALVGPMYVLLQAWRLGIALSFYAMGSQYMGWKDEATADLVLEPVLCVLKVIAAMLLYVCDSL
ncbi:hypothetical protein BDV95DRAFT_595657 [Massariosphaeria phaeospora]|uniref:Uncharacterized protein n=1 Tax=Massariosphaeria phaeospora TaxID=100035 RepID=A0A7C8I3P1_9PLEO|nr:hypothetical protein BDV95DRAFT_595657 [Massariosphaeria phaeospora]